METNIQMTEQLRELAKKHFVMLESHNVIKKCDTLQLRLSGYADVMYLISDIVKTCILALNDGGSNYNRNIPEPDTNISGVLGIILDLVPYEEAELLDKIRESVLNPAGAEPDTAFNADDEIRYENLFLSPPAKQVN